MTTRIELELGYVTSPKLRSEILLHILLMFGEEFKLNATLPYFRKSFRLQIAKLI